jgi:hypothetical protein
MRWILYLLLPIGLLSACTDGGKKSTDGVTVKAVESKRGPHALPPMDKATYEQLQSTVTQVDYIFHSLPFSVNQTERPAIQTNLAMISPERANDVTGCPIFARESFQVNGEIVLEADIYFNEGCYAYVFYQGKDKVFANKITDQGKQFYNNLINQVKLQSQ